MLADIAASIAQRAHLGQTDKAGADYVTHPYRVAENARVLARALHPNLDEDLVACVGLLHDVLEDCPEWTSERLLSEGMSAEIVECVETLTHREGEQRQHYLQRIVEAGLIPTLVKAADLADNSDPKRIELLAPEVQIKMLEKYQPDSVLIANALIRISSEWAADEPRLIAKELEL